jgi:hypothetical protein
MSETGTHLDLTDMSTVDAAQLLGCLRTAEIIIGHWSNGDRKILKGEGVVQAIAGGQMRPAAVLGLRLANNEQMHIVAAALQIIAAGKMDAQASLSLWSMLAEASRRSEVAGPEFPANPPSAIAATSYPDAATRGKLRLWKQRLARRYRQFERSYKRRRLAPSSPTSSKRTGRGGAVLSTSWCGALGRASRWKACASTAAHRWPSGRS